MASLMYKYSYRKEIPTMKGLRSVSARHKEELNSDRDITYYNRVLKEIVWVW